MSSITSITVSSLRHGYTFTSVIKSPDKEHLPTLSTYFKMTHLPSPILITGLLMFGVSSYKRTNGIKVSMDI